MLLPGGKCDVIKLFLVSFEVKIRVPLSFVQWSRNLAQGVNSEVLILNWSQKLRYKYVLKEKNSFFRKNEIFAQALLDKLKYYHGNTLCYC